MSHYQRACRLTVYVGNADIEHHRSLSGEILHRAHHAGLHGATTLHGIEGFGHSGKIHGTPKWTLVDRTPIIVHIIDSPERIRAFLPQLDEFAGKCLIICDEVEMRVPTGSQPS